MTFRLVKPDRGLCYPVVRAGVKWNQKKKGRKPKRFPTPVSESNSDSHYRFLALLGKLILDRSHPMSLITVSY